MGLEVKNQLQKFFDKDIYAIAKKGNFYYVRLDEDDEVFYVTDINGKDISDVYIPLPEIENMELIYSKYREE